MQRVRVCGVEAAVGAHVKVFARVAVEAGATPDVFITHVAHHSESRNGGIVQMPKNHH